jgi:polyferredoxin
MSDNNIDFEIINNILPHNKSIEINIINLREMIHIILYKLINKENPIPYINSSPDNFFMFAILLIIIGTLLLLLSNLMKN